MAARHANGRPRTVHLRGRAGAWRAVAECKVWETPPFARLLADGRGCKLGAERAPPALAGRSGFSLPPLYYQEISKCFWLGAPFETGNDMQAD